MRRCLLDSSKTTNGGTHQAAAAEEAAIPSLHAHCSSSAGQPCCSERLSQSALTMRMLPHFLAALVVGWWIKNTAA
jgi:hypothetical protein